MCMNVACSFYLPAFKVRASTRLRAAMADENEAYLILLSLGFKGLSLKSNGGNIIKYKYKSYDETKLNRMMGEPKGDIKAENIRYPYGVNGLLAVWPGKSEVLLRNRNKVGKDNIELPTALKHDPAFEHVDEPTPPVHVEPRTGTQNDDSHVPVTHLPAVLQQHYARAQTQPKYRVKFMQDLWAYLNRAKFAGKMRQPNLELMKGSAAAKMRVRGYWAPSTWSLKMHPQIFNATQDFFVEIFLHEMCHQAVSEEWHSLTVTEKEDNNKHAGHGTVWAKWMRHVGLNPLRFDPREARVYMDEEEKSKHDEVMEKWQKTGAEVEALGLHPLGNPSLGSAVIVRRVEGLVKGYLVCQTKKSTNEWAVLKEETVEHYVTGQPFNWMLAPMRTVYDNPQGRDKEDDPKFLAPAGRIMRHYQEKKDAADLKRAQNKRRRELDY